MKGIIIGAGIGGLTAAIALQKFDIDFEIFEAAPELKPLGAGIVMASNAMQVFKRLNIDRDIMAAGREVAEAYVTDEKFGVISGMKLKDEVVPIYGVGSYAVHRGRLQQALLGRIKDKTVHLNKRLMSISQSGDKVVVSFEDGSSYEADFAIGADGIKSMVRKCIFGETPFRYSGQTCWRGMADFTLSEDQRYTSYEMWGRKKGLRFGFVPTADREVYFFTTYFTERDGRDVQYTVKSEMLKHFASFGDLPRRLIEATPEEKIIRSDISDFIPLKKWWKGSIVLMGDAAHATTPNLGQGGCQAVEDAYVIAMCLKSESSIESAFEKYQSIRYEKAVYVVNTSWSFSRLTNVDNALGRWLRNSLLKLVPTKSAVRQLEKIFKLNY